MGLWNFVKNAGKKLVGKDDAPETAQDALNKEIESLGLDAGELNVTVEGDKVMLKGKAPTQEQREKIILAVGNVDGVASVEDELEVGDDAAEPVFYTVKSGDTLSAIAQETMGAASKYHAIFEANKPMLSHPDKIYPGQNLRIPQDA